MNEPFDMALATSTLLQAWTTGQQITALPATARPQTLAQGYDIQDSFVAATGQAVAGWKLGLGSAKAKRATGLGGSVAGRILQGRLYPAGATVPLPNNAPATLEIEVAIVLARSVQPGDAIDDPMALVGEVRLTTELVQARYTDRRAVGWPSFAADNAGFQALVVGPVMDGLAQLHTLRQTLVVDVDGQRRAGAATGDDITDPLQAFADLLALAQERRMVLPQGAIISTGAQSLPSDVTGPANISARCDLAELAFSITSKGD